MPEKRKREWTKAETVRYRRPRCAHCEGTSVLKERGALVNGLLYVRCKDCGKKTKCVEITAAEMHRLV